MKKKQIINWLVGTGVFGVLMGGLSTAVSASLLANRYPVSGYVGSNKTNDSSVFIANTLSAIGYGVVAGVSS